MKQSIASLVKHLEAWTRAEIVGQQKLADCLMKQMEAVAEQAPADVVAATQSLDRELGTVAKRLALKQRILAGFEEHWGVPASTMSLVSIAERVGAEGAPLLELRKELRDASATVVGLNRKASALLALHRGLYREIIETLLADEHGNPLEQAGSLVDASV